MTLSCDVLITTDNIYDVRCIVTTVASRAAMAQAALDGNNGKYIRYYPLSTPEIQQLFNAESTVAEIPFRPSGGDLFIFRNDDVLKQNDWKADGHT